MVGLSVEKLVSMATACLRALLAEQRLSETGLTLRSLCAEAGWSLEMVFVESRTDLAQALHAHCPDVAFLQLALLQPDAPARLSVLHQSHPSIPFILFADAADTDCAVSCLSMGAQDFMLEGFMDERTMARALRSAGVQRRAHLLAQVAPQKALGETSSGLGLEPVTTYFRHAGPAFEVSISIHIAAPVNLLPQTVTELDQLLRCSIRSTDTLLPFPPCKWEVRLSGIVEAPAHSILDRLKAKLRSFRPSFDSSAELAFNVCLEKCRIGEVSPAFDSL